MLKTTNEFFFFFFNTSSNYLTCTNYPEKCFPSQNEISREVKQSGDLPKKYGI